MYQHAPTIAFADDKLLKAKLLRFDISTALAVRGYGQYDFHETQTSKSIYKLLKWGTSR